MDSRWFKEDRELPQHEQEDAKAKTTKSLNAATVFQRKLERILTDMISEGDRGDEDFDKPSWQRSHIANISRRKALKEVIKLIQI